MPMRMQMRMQLKLLMTSRLQRPTKRIVVSDVIANLFSALLHPNLHCSRNISKHGVQHLLLVAEHASADLCASSALINGPSLGAFPSSAPLPINTTLPDAVRWLLRGRWKGRLPRAATPMFRIAPAISAKLHRCDLRRHCPSELGPHPPDRHVRVRSFFGVANHSRHVCRFPHHHGFSAFRLPAQQTRERQVQLELQIFNHRNVMRPTADSLSV